MFDCLISDLTDYVDAAQDNGPPPLADLAEPEHCGEPRLAAGGGDHLVRADRGRVHPKHGEDGADEDAHP